MLWTKRFLSSTPNFASGGCLPDTSLREIGVAAAAYNLKFKEAPVALRAHVICSWSNSRTELRLI
jgi:hypothetical protein